MDFQQATLIICAVGVAYVWYKRYRKSMIGDIPGPENPSWVYGHLWWWQREEVAVIEKRILEEYGTVARWNGCFGEQCLWIADPKAIHYILQGSGYLYQRPSLFIDSLLPPRDRGLAMVEGETHKRHRRVMAPAFGPAESKALYPYFSHCSNSLADKWNEIISNTESGQAATLNVHAWLSKATLDAIGAGALDYDFGALENANNKLANSYASVGFGVFQRPSKGRILMMGALRFLPGVFVAWMRERDKRPGTLKVREIMEYGREVGAKLIEDKKQELKNGASRRDILSLIVKANSAMQPDRQLSEDEMIAQVRTIMSAGHETTARTLTFGLWELAKNHRVQEKLREEVTETLGQIKARGKSDFTVEDFDSMPYLVAVVKEMLRVYPIAIGPWRAAETDTILPLAKPVTGVSGKVYNELFVPARTAIYISTVGYNSNKDIWGRDADEFRPERWFEMGEKPESSIGVYGNLSTFSGGNKSCIGWRIAVIEMHAFLATLIRQFDFSLPDGGQRIQGVGARPGILAPVVVGEEHKGPQMPIKITALGNE